MTTKSRDDELDKKQINNLSKLGPLKKIFGRYAVRVFSDGMRTLNNRASNLMEKNQKSIVVDLGTGDAKLLKDFNRKINSKNLYGLDLSNTKNTKIKYIKTDLEKSFPIKNNFTDVVISSQNIEHIINIPNYCNEVFRILKPGGYAIILTENLASWANISCLIMGYIPFSLTNMFGKPYGNPFVWHKDLHDQENFDKYIKKKQWGILGHQRILTLKGLEELLKRNGLETEKKFGGGYGISIGLIQRFLSFIDKTHAHFIGIKVRKNRH